MSLQVIIQVIDEQGTVLIYHQDNALKPTQKKLDPEKPVSDDEYKLFGFTYQPHVMLKSKSGGY